MESFFSRYRNALVLITVLLAQVIGLAVQVRRPGQTPEDKGGVLLIRSWVIDTVAPAEQLLHASGLGLRSVWMNYIDLLHVRDQDKDLRAEVDRLRLEEASLAEDARQGQRLQALLGFQEKYVYRTVVAQVIGSSGTESSEVLIIDKGQRDGIHPDMPVITPDGIVGKTRDVFAHTSQVLEVSDPTSGAGVILQNTRIRGVLRGNSWGQPEIVNVSPDERIKPGEPVLTSGGDAIFPRGLAVGVVDRVVPDPDGTLVNVLVKPAANLSKLEEVLIITSTGDRMPAQMQQDLSDSQQSASEILAARLPSRADPSAPASQQDNADTTVGPDGEVTLPMRPPKALHADRYTPSDTPPAADLIPGQRIQYAQLPPDATNEGAAARTEHDASGPDPAATTTLKKQETPGPADAGQHVSGRDVSGQPVSGQHVGKPASAESGAYAQPAVRQHPAPRPSARPLSPESPVTPVVPSQNTPPQGAL